MATMTVASARTLIGKTITLHDYRTGHNYEAKIIDVKESWGKVRMMIEQDRPRETWFEPTYSEMESVKD